MVSDVYYSPPLQSQSPLLLNNKIKKNNLKISQIYPERNKVAI